MIIPILDNASLLMMKTAGDLLSQVFATIASNVVAGLSTADLDSLIERELDARKLVPGSKGYMGYKHASCISLNDEVVHGIPSSKRFVNAGDLVKIDVCASYHGFFADMARSFLVPPIDESVRQFVNVARLALDKGIVHAREGNRLSDISAAIQREVESHGYGVVRDFAGHGIGRAMHEEPEILNYGVPGKGPILKVGMALALEPMITMKSYRVFVEHDGWTVRTVDGGLAAHVEDTVIITDNGPMIITRSGRG